MSEVWKDIPVYDGIYEASTLGRIRSKVTGRLAHTFKSEKGYIVAKIFLNGQCKNEKIHRLVAMTFLPNPNNLPQVNHKDYNRANNNVDNLEWCTCEQNIQHSLINLPAKRVQCYGKVFASIGQCCRHFGVPETTMRNWLNGKRKMPDYYKQGDLKLC